MIFYECDVKIANFTFSDDNDERMKEIQDLNQKISEINCWENADYQAFLYYAINDRALFNFVIKQNETCGIAGELCEEMGAVCSFQDIISNFIKALDIEGNSFIKETTEEIFTERLRKCKGAQYFYNYEIIVRLGGEEYLRGQRENPVRYAMSKSKIITEAHNLLVANTLVSEIERIYEGGKDTAANGHPVHYIIKCDDLEKCEDVTNLLLTALNVNNRIKSNKASNIRIDGKYWTHNEYFKTFRSLSGGVAAIICHKENYNGENSDETIKEMADMLSKYNRDILFFFLMPENSKSSQKLISQNLCGTTFVTINEETLMESDDMPFEVEVRSYLRKMAEDANVEPTEDLFENIVPDYEYRSKELKNLFDRWNNNRLKTEVYTQYAELETPSEPFKYEDFEDDNKDSTYNELFSMIGLTEAKAVIQQALDFHKAQMLFRENGIEQERPSMHMAFTGNPGVAKTTVARLFANILKENGLIEKGLVEVSRADLVGRYIGHTAPLVKEVFNKSRGGVLFIDEAYTLVDSRDNSFGDEAIGAIVKEMEDMRNEVIVIFAGYPEKMEEFLSKNPGLRSRISFNVPFSDYDIGELYAITELLSKKQGIALASDVEDKLAPIFSAAMKQENFGNGRFARTLIEKARLKQSSRLVKMDSAKLRKSDFVLTADDFETPVVKQETRQIGFFAT